MIVKIRLFAALREVAGSNEVEVEADTVGGALEALAARFGERFEQIARAGSAVVDGERANLDTSLRDAREVALLPPVSGGTTPVSTGGLRSR